MTHRQRLLLFSLFFGVIAIQYCYNLDGTGVLSTDEPRYAAIGREMALSGDWITPRLWGSPWFEKPALLYWLTAIGTVSGLSPDLAGRLPVALLSLAFLIAWFLLLKREWGERTAAIATALLATSAGWFVFSGICVTDLPMAAFFSIAVVLSLRLLRGGESLWLWVASGAALGFAVLAKGLVPLVLVMPLLWFLRRQWRRWFVALLAFAVVAGPWYAAVYARNGDAFLRVFFLEQQFSRLYSPALQHLQPPYYYLPVTLAAVFPWTFIFPFARPLWRDPQWRCLAVTFLFGLLFFSISRNKLAGYILPLLPLLFAVLAKSIVAAGLDRRRSVLIAAAAGVALLPVVAQLVPTLMSAKIDSLRVALLALLPLTLSFLVLFFTPLIIGARASLSFTGPLLVLCASLAAIDLRSTVYPVLDRQVSPRSFWKQIRANDNRMCDAGLHRAWAYGLAFYRGAPIPYCDAAPREFHLVQKGLQPARIIKSR